MNETTKNIEEVTEEDVIIENPYPLRRLSSKDIFVFSTIMKQIGYAELKGCFDSVKINSLISNFKGKKTSVDAIGVSIMMDISTIVISNLASAEDSIYQLLSNLSGKTKSEIASLDAEVFMAMIVDVFKQDGFRNFFRVVSKLFK